MELHHRTPPTTAEVVTLIYLRILSVASRVSTARLERIALHRIDCVRLSVHYINRSRRSGWEHSIIDRDLGCRAIAQVQTTTGLVGRSGSVDKDKIAIRLTIEHQVAGRINFQRIGIRLQ